MQVCESMGDARHKKTPPPAADEEDVTDSFRREVLEALDINARQNRLRGIKKGEAGYLISNRAELADAIGADKILVNRMIGAARAGTKLRPINRSAYVGRIRNVLQLAAVSRITVKAARAPIVQFIAELPDEEFRIFEDEYRRAQRRSSSDPR